MLYDNRSVWDVFGDMQRVLDSYATTPSSRLWQGLQSEHPPATVHANDDTVAVSFELPGVARDDIELSVEGDTLTVRAKRTTSVSEDATVLRRERGDLDSTRSITLPFAVDADSAEARYARGVLVVVLQRQEADKPKRIAVATA